MIDVRDLVYYASITGTFLALNTVILKAKSWSQGTKTAPIRRNWSAWAALVAANLFVFNVLLFPIHAARIDLTERGEYSISPVTKTLIRDLSEPLLIRGYFSEKTHPLLAPMVPRIRDLIEEYGAVSDGKVRTEYVDPRGDQEVEKEANQTYNIKSFPFACASLRRRGRESYFSILEVRRSIRGPRFRRPDRGAGQGMNDIDVKLRNPSTPDAP